MMVLSSLRPDSSIVEYLEYRARASTVRGLLASTLLALAVLLGALRVMPFAKSVVVTLALTYFCYGAWGLSDRGRFYSHARGWTGTGKVLRWLATGLVGLGVLSGVALLMSICFLLLGPAWVL